MDKQKLQKIDLKALATPEMIAVADRYDAWILGEIGRIPWSRKIVLTIIAMPFALVDLSRDRLLDLRRRGSRG
jgi:hypothetical protein